MKSKSQAVKSWAADEAFYRPLGDGVYASSPHTAGPWSADAQHAGPPTALVARELLRIAPPSMFPARLTFELLGPIPVGELTVHAAVERPGRSVTLVGATLCAAGRDVLRAAAWMIAPAAIAPAAAALAADDYAPPALPRRDSLAPAAWRSHGYIRAMRWRFARGGFGEPGPAAVWGRMRVALVAGEDAGPLGPLLALADSASGVSSVLDPREWLFINPELTIHLHRLPGGEWVGLDARTRVSDGGAGLAQATLFDRDGAVGASAQTLLVRKR